MRLEGNMAGISWIVAGLVESTLRNLEPHSSGIRVIQCYLFREWWGPRNRPYRNSIRVMCTRYGSYDSVISRTVCMQIVNLAIFTEVHSVRAGCDHVYCTPVLEQLCLYVTSNSFARDGCSGRDVYAIIVVNCWRHGVVWLVCNLSGARHSFACSLEVWSPLN